MSHTKEPGTDSSHGHRRHATALCVAAVLMGTALPAFGKVAQPIPTSPASRPPAGISSQAATGKAPADQATSDAQPSPAWVTYSFFFKHLANLDQIADEQEALGKRVEADEWRTYDQRMAALSEEEGAILKQVAYGCNQAVQDQDAKLQTAVTASKGQHGGAARRPTQSEGERPPELTRLGDGRIQIIVAHVDELRRRLGEAAFEGLDRYVQEVSQPTAKATPRPAAVKAPSGTDTASYVYVYTRSMTSGSQVTSECGTIMGDNDTIYDYVGALSNCFFFDLSTSTYTTFSCAGFGGAVCSKPFSSLTADTYETDAGSGLIMYADADLFNYWDDPLGYGVPLGQPLPVFTGGQGFVFPQGVWLYWPGGAELGISYTYGVPFTLGPKLTLTPASLAFGDVNVNSSADKDFVVKNTGGGTLTGTASINSTGFSITSPLGGAYSVAAGLTQNVTVHFSPSSVGSFTGNVIFTGGGGATGPVSGRGVDPHRLTINSNVPSGISINVFPSDKTGKASGTTPITFDYLLEEIVQFTAPATAPDGSTFAGFGTTCDSVSDRTCYVTMTADKNVMATYATPVRTLTVLSAPSNVTIGVNGQAAGVTPFSRTFSNGTSVTLTAPASVGASSFVSWTGCDSTLATTCNVTMSSDKTVSAGYATPVRALTIASVNPSSGASITVSPNDRGGQGNGVTPFSRAFNNNQVVTLTAVTPAGANTFGSWSGCDSSPGATCIVTMNADRTVTATYVTPVRTLTVASSNPGSGAAITVTPSDRNSQANGTTPFSRSYDNNSAVTLTAFPTAGVNEFGSWSGCTSASGATCNVTMSADKTVTVTYVPLTKTLTVASSTPSTGAAITVSPNDKSGFGSGVTQFTRIYDKNAAVTLGAALTAGGNNFQSWSGCDSSSGITCNVTMSADKTVTAAYIVPRMPVKPVFRNLPTHVVGPRSFTANVEMDAAAPAGGITVGLTSSNPAVASVPTSVGVSAGATLSAPFTVNTSVVAVSTTVTLTAAYHGNSGTGSFIVDPPVYEGYLDGADCSSLVGWAWDPNRPNTSITVDIYANGVLQAASVSANGYRADLVAAGKGNGYHGFGWAVPSSLKNGVTYSMVVKYGGTGTALGATPKTITCTSPSVSVAWIKPAEVTWGPAGTLTVAGYAQNGTGGVTMYWQDATTGGGWNVVGYVAPPDATNVWYNTIPSSNNCHTYNVYATYSGVTSSVFTYNGLSSGYCHEAARVIWMQPQALAGFGPPGSIVLAGSATGAPSGTLVQVWTRDATAGTGWSYLGASPPDGSGIWYQAIQGANASHVYSAYVTYDVITSATCSYAGNNAQSWCP